MTHRGTARQSHLIAFSLIAILLQNQGFAADKTALRERVDSQRVVRTASAMTAEGDFFLDPPVNPKTAKPDKDQPESLKVQVTTKLVVQDRWQLAELADGPAAGVLLAHRVVEVAEANVGGQVRGSSSRMRKERRRFLADIQNEMVRNGSLDGTITRPELEAVTAPGDGITLWTLLPKDPVVVGDTYKMDNLAAKSLTLYDTIAVNGLEGRVETMDADRVKIQITGEVRGALLGAEGKIKFKGTLGFNRAEGLVDSLVVSREENRRPGTVEAGLQIQSDLEVRRQVMEKPAPELAEAVRGDWPKSIENSHLQLSWAEPAGLYGLEHDRDWHVTWSDTQESVLKRVDRGGTVIAQCNLKRGPTVAAGRHQDPAQFRDDVREALGDQFRKVFGEGVLERPQDQGYGYKLAVEGLIQELPVVWYYYLMASPGGEQVMGTVTTTLAETQNGTKAVLGLVESLRWSVQAEKAEKSAK